MRGGNTTALGDAVERLAARTLEHLDYRVHLVKRVPRKAMRDGLDYPRLARRPMFAVDDLPYRLLGDAVLTPELVLTDGTAVIHRKYLDGDLWRDFRSMVPLATPYELGVHRSPIAVLTHHIATILASSPDAEVGRVTTRGIIAAMQDKQSGRNWAFCQRIGQSVGKPMLALISHASIARRYDASRPYPTAVRLLDLRPKLFGTLAASSTIALGGAIDPTVARITLSANRKKGHVARRAVSEDGTGCGAPSRCFARIATHLRTSLRWCHGAGSARSAAPHILAPFPPDAPCRP